MLVFLVVDEALAAFVDLAGAFFTAAVVVFLGAATFFTGAAFFAGAGAAFYRYNQAIRDQRCEKHIPR